MQIVFESASGRSELHLKLRGRTASVADLATALGLPPEQGLVVGDRRAGPAVSLTEAGVHQGVVVRPLSVDGGGTVPPAGGHLIEVSGGLVAGPAWPLPPGTTRVGRDSANHVVVDHPTVSARHCAFTSDGPGTVTVSDAGSRNGTWLDGEPVSGRRTVPVGSVVRIGAVLVSLTPAESEPAPAVLPARGVGAAGTVAFNRPPRTAPPGGPPPLRLPASPPDPPAVPLSVVALLAPLAFAGVMVAVLGRAVYALFALLGPVMALGTWLEGRRRGRKATRFASRQLAVELRHLRASADEGARAEMARLRARCPHPAEMLRRSAAGSPRLWERRPRHDDFLCLHLGTGDLNWRPELVQDGRPSAEALQALEIARTLRGAPVPLELAGGGVVGVVGERAPALAVARSLVCQAATQSGPADLMVAVLTGAGQGDDWDWAKWLPHAHPHWDGDDGHLLSSDPGTSDAVLRRLLASPGGRKGPEGSARSPLALVVVDDQALLEGRGSRARAVLEGQAGPVAGVVVATSEHRLPAVCSAVVTLDGPDGQARLVHPDRGEVVGPFVVAGVEEPVARGWARSLARFEDPESPPYGAGPPEAVTLMALLGFDAHDPLAMAEAWADHAGGWPGTPIGAGPSGVVRLDLDTDAHLDVEGPSGSGTSELLRATVAGLAASVGPDRLSVLLLDPSGDGSLTECSRLPHAVGLACGPEDVAGAVEELARELDVRRRRGPAGSPQARGRRLVAVVDDADALPASHPAVVALAGVAARGPASGIHLLVAGEEGWAPAGRRRQGRARVRLGRAGRGEATLEGYDGVFQAAAVTGRTPPGCGAVEVLPFRFGPGPRGYGARAGDADRPLGGERTDLAGLVRAAREAAAGANLAAPAPLWPPAHAASPEDGVQLPTLLGITDVAAVDPTRHWRPRAEPERLRVPIGVTSDGAPLCLDLKEAALGGTGPHGLVVGATGSGKSELLRTLVCALAITHPPDQLSLVLVDFKGGATFAGLAGLPHVAGMITNLQDDLGLVDRMHDALDAERRRRQELLRRAGGLASAHEHEELRATGRSLPPLPSLLVIVDEFAELLDSRPDFADLFVGIGRVGRSLGMHLLLATQRLDEGRVRGLESHFGYRIALRTFNATESKAAIGVGDAHCLPLRPGSGYLKVGAAAPQRFRAAFVSASRHPGPEETDGGCGGSGSVVDVAVSRLRHAAAPAHQVWLPPLPPALGLDGVLPPLVEDAGRGLVALGWPGVGRLAVPVGLVDQPREQGQSPLVVDLAGAGGNLALIGAPQSGKSTFLRALASALMVTHTPGEVQLYCVDYGGGGLHALEQAPHTGAVAGRLHLELARRVLSEVRAVLDGREKTFRRHGIDSASSFRAMQASGRLPEESHGDVFLVVDNWPAFRLAWEPAEEMLTDIAARGLGFGVHVVVTANQWTELRGRLRDSFGTRLELRLNEPAESAIDRRAAASVPKVAGRGLTPDGLHFQTCLPRVDGRASADDAQAGLAALVARARAAWPGPVAPPVRLLPRMVPFTDLPGPAAGTGLVLGLEEPDLAPSCIDLAGPEPHFLVFGDSESGKTACLRALVTALIARFTPREAALLVVDYRRGLLDAVGPGHLFGYAGAAPAAAAHVARLREVLSARLPGADVPRLQLRDRSWWTGPDVYVIVDDYDLVVTPSGNPLAPLLELVAQGGDLGLHLVLARRVSGASRAMYEPVLQRVKELGSPGLILSGDAQEGALLGAHRAGEQPPGRGLLVRRAQSPRLVQVAWVPP